MPGSGAAKSNTSATRRLRRTAKIASASITPSKPPWNDMPPSQTLNGYHGILRPERQPVEQHVADASAEDGAEHAEEHEVVDVGGLPGRAGLLRAQAREPPARRERDQVHDSVPVDLEVQRTRRMAEGPDLERDIVEAGVLDHAALNSTFIRE